MRHEDWLRTGERSWCPGCGNFKILDALAGALERLSLEPWRVVVVSGIGQSGKLPHYLKVNFLHGLHGRTLAMALGVKLANPGLTVIAVGGDGDLYGEGGNHLMHAFRRNADICCLVHNNGVYGLTKGQASPTAGSGFRDGLHPAGTLVPAFNPLAVGIACQGTFLARGFAGQEEQLTGLMVEAVRHPGFGFVDILQPCVTYNRVNTFKWYADRVYDLVAEGHDPADRAQAMVRALEWPGTKGERIPLGVFLRGQRAAYEQGFPALARGALTDYVVEPGRVLKAAEEFR
jgi:2-oxoglutarate ferredoxin oxidoreductase subunit beta